MPQSDEYENNNVLENPNPPSVTDDISDKMYSVTGGGNTMGLGLTLKVMAGDKLDILGKTFYTQSNSQLNSGFNLNDLLAMLLNAPSGATSGSHTVLTDLTLNANVTGPISSFLSNTDRNAGSRPKAFINYILLDEQFRYVSGNFSPVSSSANVVKSHYDDSQLQDIEVSKNGYLYVYVSNESPVAVFFDNLQVVHTRGRMLVETHYYPFGLTMKGISSKILKDNFPDNKKGFSANELQNAEFNDGSGLELYDFNARTYDQQTGRFIQIDPLSEEGDQETWSPYHNSYNNTLRFSDPDGKFPIIPFIIITVGLLTASKPAIAPTGRPGEARAIKQAYDNYNMAVFSSFVPGSGASGPVSRTLYQEVRKKIVKEVVKTEVEQVKKKFNGQTSTESTSANEALRNAKDQNGIPRSQQPDRTIKPNTPDGDKAKLDDRNVKQYEYTNSQGEKVVVRQDKPANYSDGGTQPAHFNAGQNPTQQKDLKQHHTYNPNTPWKPMNH